MSIESSTTRSRVNPDRVSAVLRDFRDREARSVAMDKRRADFAERYRTEGVRLDEIRIALPTPEELADNASTTPEQQLQRNAGHSALYAAEVRTSAS